MNEKVNERVDVVTIYRKNDNQHVFPYKISWNNRDYIVDKIGYHHKVKEGDTIVHIFCVSSKTLDLRLRLNSDTLSWILEEVVDAV